ncbi:MAG: hypothetical protein ACRD1B_09675 [Thermoanaerobaculia bacterium]
MTREYLEGSHQAASDFRTYLEERFQGEVYGEALFRTMAKLAEDPERGRKLRVLEQLERETKELLLPALREAGGSGDENPERINEGETLGASLAKAPWTDLLHGFERELRRFVEDFERAEALAPPGQEALLRHVTAHERALLDFAIREREQSTAADSLESVLELLRTPPAA